MTSNTHLKKNENGRKPYRTPQLESLGDLRSLTLGGSIGGGESGFPNKALSPIIVPGVSGIRRPDGSILLPDGSILPPPQP
jgi:hypothetical protein